MSISGNLFVHNSIYISYHLDFREQHAFLEFITIKPTEKTLHLMKDDTCRDRSWVGNDCLKENSRNLFGETLIF